MGLLLLLQLFPLLAEPAILSAQPVEDQIRDGLLERETPTLEMDANQDGIVDVADLVRTSRGERQAYFVESASIEVDRTITRNVEVRFASSFTGTLAYSVTGTATPGVDYTTLPGTVAVNGTSAFIPVQIHKDFLYEGQETVILTIQPGNGYSVASPSSHVLTIQDIETHFVQSKTTVREASQTINLEVAFNFPFQGLLKYSITGSATQNVDYQLPFAGSIVVDGTRANIPIRIIDDLEMEDSEYLTVDLDFNFDVQDDDLDYDLGVPTRALVLLNDNDTVWTGTLVTDNSEETLQIEVRTDGTVTQAAILSATNPDDEAGFLSVGTIPAGNWIASSALLDASSLDMAFGPIPLGKLQLFGDINFQRYIFFTVDPSRAYHLVRQDTMVGEFTSIIEPVSPGRDFLRRTSTGPVFLIRGMSNLPFPEHEILNP